MVNAWKSGTVCNSNSFSLKANTPAGTRTEISHERRTSLFLFYFSRSAPPPFSILEQVRQIEMGSLQLLTSSPFLLKQANCTPTATPSLISNGCFSLHNAVNTRRGAALHRARAVVDRKEIDENPEGIISGEWQENFSLLTYEDLCAYLKPNLVKEKTQPSVVLGEIMSTTIRPATPDQTLEEIDHYFEIVSGLPVLDEQKKCIGIVSKKDRARASQGLKSKVQEVMSFPAITLPPSKTVLDAAALMLKNKIHRIPIVNESGQVIGMVTRTDIFQALENQSA